MTNVQESKALVLDYFKALEDAQPSEAGEVLSRFTGADYRMRAVHPFNELHGAEQVAETLWGPLLNSFTALQRRQDIFMAGLNQVDGFKSLWVTSMGKFMGLFDENWLGIPATGKLALLPYCEFHRIDGGRIAESAFFCDIVSVMKQAGLQPFPMQTGAEIVNPGPRTQDGLLFGEQDAAQSQQTLQLITRMCEALVADYLCSPDEMLHRDWHPDMLWFGPSGIGATYTISRYQLQHQNPFRHGLNNIKFTGHELEHAEGCYGGWWGWPNLTMNPGDGFMGLPASERPVEMRVVDMYRRDGDKLAENWIFIDLLHYMKLQGVDVLQRCREIGLA